MQDHYSILGVPRNADQELIKITYRALVRIYHSDLYKGDKKFADEHLKKINIAYEILSDPKARKKYDEQVKQSVKEDEPPQYEDETSKEEYEIYQKLIKEEWRYALEFYPELKTEYEILQKYSKQLAYRFQIWLVETKSFDDFNKISGLLKTGFIILKFGVNEDLNEFVKDLIENGHKKYVIELYNSLNRLGINSLGRILERITPKYPQIEEDYPRDLYNLGYSEPENVRQRRLNKIANKDSSKLVAYIFYIFIGAVVIMGFFYSD